MDRRQFLALTSCVTALLPDGVFSAPIARPTIALVGATARSGRAIVHQGLEQGFRIKGLARTPSKLAMTHENLQLFQADVRDQNALEAALDGSEVIISVVGYPSPKTPDAVIGHVDLYTTMARNLIAAMKKKGNRRLIITSSTGVEHRTALDSKRPPPDDLSADWRWRARYLYDDMFKMEQLVENSGLDYVILRPGFLATAPARGNLKIQTTGPTPAAMEITYADFAAFALGQVTSDTYLNMAVGLYSDTPMNPAAAIEEAFGKQQ